MSRRPAFSAALGIRLTAAIGSMGLLLQLLLPEVTLRVPAGTVTPEPMEVAVPPPSPSELAPLEHWTEIIRHPLFHPSRLPWSPPKVQPAPAAPQPTPRPPPAPPAPPSQWILEGTVLSQGRRSAILHSVAANQSRLVHEGDRLENWTVIVIAHDQIALSQANANWTITFQKSR